MLSVVSIAVVLQPAMRAARLTNASARERLESFFMILSLGPAPSVQDEAVFAAVLRRSAGRTPRRAIDLVDAAEQDGSGVGRVHKTVIRARQVLLGDGARDIWRHDHHQLGLPVDVVAAL